MRTRPEIPLFVLSALAVLGIIALAVLHTAVPDILTIVAAAALGGGAGATIPTVITGLATGVTTPPPAPPALATLDPAQTRPGGAG